MLTVAGEPKQQPELLRARRTYQEQNIVSNWMPEEVSKVAEQVPKLDEPL